MMQYCEKYSIHHNYAGLLIFADSYILSVTTMLLQKTNKKKCGSMFDLTSHSLYKLYCIAYGLMFKINCASADSVIISIESHMQNSIQGSKCVKIIPSFQIERYIELGVIGLQNK